jgi:lactoylglutathione lyase
MRDWTSTIAAVFLIGSSTSAAAEQKTPLISAMDHVAISVSDPDKSASFYQEIFGFRQIPAPVPMARWLVMANGIMLHIVGNRTAESPHSRWDHLAMACADMDTFIAKLDSRHVAWSNMEGGHSPQVRSDGVKQIFIQDPDGYWIEVNDSLKKK